VKGKLVHKTANMVSITALIAVVGLIFLSPTRNTLAQVPGDANNDGNINILDVTATLNDILEIAPAAGDADCNEDGNVNILDVTCVLNIILGPSPTPTPGPTPETHDVSMIDNEFVPADITINVGDTVRWTNNGQRNHTATSAEEPVGSIFNSDSQFPLPTGMQPGDVFEFTFNQEGDFPYFCEFHGTPAGIGMAGTVTVE
jgi:plastocyanin